MDSAVLSASAAVLGSLAGGSASIATAWLTLKTQGRRQAIQVETRKRELLYSEFITECSKLALDALDHSLERPETLLQAYSLVSRIRLTSSEAVLHAGRGCDPGHSRNVPSPESADREVSRDDIRRRNPRPAQGVQ